MKKFEYNFYNVWGGDRFDLFTVDFYKAKTATWLEITICNFEFDFTFRTDKQIKAQKKWDKEMEARSQEWTNEEVKSAKLPSKKKTKKVAKKK